MAVESTPGLSLYFCYAREDKALREKLEKHLAALKRQGYIITWYDGEIQAGTEWKQEIAHRLQTANIILLLISPDFLASEDIYQVDMMQAIARHKQGEALVIPVLLRPVDWDGTPISELQALPINGKPVTSWHNLDEALQDIARGIRSATSALLENMKLFEQASKTNYETVPPSGDEPDTTNEIYQAIQSVFLFNIPLTDANEFYGRSRERAKILDRISKRASTSIVGPRRIGKTWLMQYVKLVVPSEFGSRFRVAYLDATSPRCATVPEFTSFALEQWGIHNPIPAQRKVDLVHLAHAVEDMKNRNLTPILFIDEFEGLTNEETFDLRFFTSLRAIAQTGLVLIVASKNPLIDLVSGILKTSPFFNIFERLTIAPFSIKEAEAFVRVKSDQAGFTDQERNRLLYYGQTDVQRWSPMRLQLAGTLLMEEKRLAELEDPDYYRPDDHYYWLDFEKLLEEKYREVVR
jgi:TIR domain/AAA domain